MERAGIRFRTEVNVGVDITADQLNDEFVAVVLCTGSTVPQDLPIEGRSLRGVEFAMDFLKEQNMLIADEVNALEPRYSAQDKHVLVIGGGDTGADCVGTSNRQKAKSVSQIELLPEPPQGRMASNPWPEWPMILRSSTSHEEGVHRDWAVLTKRFIGNKEGQLTHVETVKIKWINQSRFEYEEMAGSEEILPCDMALLAIGFTHPEQSLPGQYQLALDEKGNIKTTGFKTSHPKVFAAGDCRRGQSLVVWAIAEGRRVAQAVVRNVPSPLESLTI
jgi:glutamate synthase (NADPH/NADH) small chain